MYNCCVHCSFCPVSGQGKGQRFCLIAFVTKTEDMNKVREVSLQNYLAFLLDL